MLPRNPELFADVDEPTWVTELETHLNNVYEIDEKGKLVQRSNGAQIDSPEISENGSQPIEEAIEVVPELPGRPVLPGERGLDDFRLGQRCLGLAICGSRGEREFVSGTVGTIHEYDISHPAATSPGFISLKRGKTPVYIADLNDNRLIPAEALRYFTREPGYLKDWLGSGTKECIREAPLLLKALERRLGRPLGVSISESGFAAAAPQNGQVVEAMEELPDREVSLPPVGATRRNGHRPKPVAQRRNGHNLKRPAGSANGNGNHPVNLESLEQDFMSRTRGKSLYVTTEREEQDLLRQGRSGHDEMYQRYEGLAAFFAKQFVRNGTS